jgi:hypothetical protein
MPRKPPKQVEIPNVVPLTEEKRQVIATDPKSEQAAQERHFTFASSVFARLRKS